MIYPSQGPQLKRGSGNLIRFICNCLVCRNTKCFKNVLGERAPKVKARFWVDMPSCCCLGAAPNIQPSTLEVEIDNANDANLAKEPNLTICFVCGHSWWRWLESVVIMICICPGPFMDFNWGVASVNLWHRSLPSFSSGDSGSSSHPCNCWHLTTFPLAWVCRRKPWLHS